MLRLFYFSGTGNARNVANWVAAGWHERGRPAEVADLARLDRRAVHLDADDEVGIASPTHGFNFPPITLGFLFGFPRAPNHNRAFIINTRAGVRLFGVCLPGVSGAAQLLAALVLLLKGYRIVGMRPIDLPSNWISLHPGLRQANVSAIYERCRRITARFAARLLDGKRDLRALWDLPQDLLLTPISLAYYLIGRFWLAKSFIASSACDACGACVTQCPNHAIGLVDGRPYWSYRCESCMRCMNLCPKRAIETAHGFVIGVPLVLSGALTVLVYPFLRWLAPALTGPGLLARSARAIFEPVLSLAVLGLSYRLLHRGLRRRPIERLVMATSLTRLRCWRRYLAPRAPKGCPPPASAGATPPPPAGGVPPADA